MQASVMAIFSQPNRRCCIFPTSRARRLCTTTARPSPPSPQTPIPRCPLAVLRQRFQGRPAIHQVCFPSTNTTAMRCLRANTLRVFYIFYLYMFVKPVLHSLPAVPKPGGCSKQGWTGGDNALLALHAFCLHVCTAAKVPPTWTRMCSQCMTPSEACGLTVHQW